MDTVMSSGRTSSAPIEHEDSLMSAREGLQKAVSFLKEVMLREKLGQMWWA